MNAMVPGASAAVLVPASQSHPHAFDLVLKVTEIRTLAPAELANARRVFQATFATFSDLVLFLQRRGDTSDR